MDQILGNICKIRSGDVFKNTYCVSGEDDDACRCDRGFFGRAGHTGCTPAGENGVPEHLKPFIANILGNSVYETSGPSDQSVFISVAWSD